MPSAPFTADPSTTLHMAHCDRRQDNVHVTVEELLAGMSEQALPFEGSAGVGWYSNT